MMLMLLAAAVVVPSMPVTDASSQATVTAYIERCATEWARNSVRHDAEAMNRCLADDYRGISSSGKVVTKASHALPAAPSARDAGLYYAQPRFPTPDVAIVQGEEWWEPLGTGPRQHLIWTDVWMLRGGRWQIVASQDAGVPPDQPLQNQPLQKQP